MWHLVTRQSSMAKDLDEIAIFPNCILIIVHGTIYHSISRYVVTLVLHLGIQNLSLFESVVVDIGEKAQSLCYKIELRRTISE